jgi:hypothetical protein
MTERGIPTARGVIRNRPGWLVFTPSCPGHDAQSSVAPRHNPGSLLPRTADAPAEGRREDIRLAEVAIKADGARRMPGVTAAMKCSASLHFRRIVLTPRR